MIITYKQREALNMYKSFTQSLTNNSKTEGKIIISEIDDTIERQITSLKSPKF